MWFNEQIHKDICIKEIILNFMPSWWYRGYGISYGKAMIFDANYRMNADREMRRIFYDRYGRFLGAGTNNPKERVVFPDWDNTYYQAMLDFDVKYLPDHYPMAHGKLSDEQAMALKVPENFWNVYPFSEQKNQLRQMNAKLGTDIPLWVRTRGTLNEGVQICSGDFYGDLLDEDYDEKTNHVLGFVEGVIEQQLRSNKKHNPASGHVFMNCTAGIAGARAYKERVYRFDKQLYDFCVGQRIPVGLHHCGTFDDFVDIYRPMEKLNFVEIGHTSEIRLALNGYPDAQIQYIVDTNFMRTAGSHEISEFAQGVRAAVAGFESRFHLSVPDIEYGTPDSNIFALVEAFHA